MTETEIDSRINELKSKRAEIDTEMVKLAREKAKLHGWIVESPELLKCNDHPESAFDKESFEMEWKKIDVYYCHECFARYPWMKYYPDAIARWSCAYTCPSCGIVIGWMVETRYDDIGFLSGSSGRQFTCSLCGWPIGKIPEVVS